MKKKSSGFTVAEMLVVIGITVTIGAVSISSFRSFSRRQALDATAQALASTIRDARSQTVVSVGGSQYGVALAPDTFTFFKGSEYDPSAATNQVFPLNFLVQASSTLSTIVFQRLTGNSTASGTIDVYLVSDPAVKRTVGVSPTGLVSIQ